MGSVLGYSPSPEYFVTHAYAAAKSAVIGFTRSASAARYAAQNIRVNVIAPALVETPMAQRAAGDEKILSFIRTKQPLDGGRIGTPSDLDGAAVYFMSGLRPLHHRPGAYRRQRLGSLLKANCPHTHDALRHRHRHRRHQHQIGGGGCVGQRTP
ncbi:MAG: SDR family oxidoreductase [Cyclobacteriaceae bacterium]